MTLTVETVTDVRWSGAPSTPASGACPSSASMTMRQASRPSDWSSSPRCRTPLRGTSISSSIRRTVRVLDVRPLSGRALRLSGERADAADRCRPGGEREREYVSSSSGPLPRATFRSDRTSTAAPISTPDSREVYRHGGQASRWRGAVHRELLRIACWHGQRRTDPCARPVYDLDTACLIRDSPRPGLDSYDQQMQKSADGPVDNYYGPMAPTGHEANWIPTAAGKPWFDVAFRLTDHRPEVRRRPDTARRQSLGRREDSSVQRTTEPAKRRGGKGGSFDLPWLAPGFSAFKTTDGECPRPS